MSNPKFDLQIDTSYHPQIKSAAQTLYPIFQLYGWTWWREGGPKIPTLDELEDHIEEQVKYLLSLKNPTPGHYISSGRTTARLQHDGETWQIEISLELETLYDDHIGR